ncbi:MAG: phosphoribosylamine--glycine ligase [Anaerolineae bacterium]|nr:phosphoribosylamine--glycine ligase [Thermoflexales bacterium]MDW8407653.1 phosphoribosylamine--glycine ligase [Anaerolineae bacterium]
MSSSSSNSLERILVIGSGGREHALAWALAQSPVVQHIFVAPGNAGTAADLDKTTNVPVSADDIAGLVRWAREQRVGLTVVGPEAPLAAGIVDAFQQAGLPIFGPTRAAAQLETSKCFAKDFMHRHGIPTAPYAAFSDYAAARDYVRSATARGGLVVKASGLAAGKGVIVCDDAAQAEHALKQIMLDREFGAAGDVVIIEERLSGPELSVLALCDGKTVALLPPARDHKRVFDHDQGPNTGGMGAFSPVPGIDKALLDEVRRTVLQPAIDGMAAYGAPYTGVLYAGLMLTERGPQVLEFNCRLGDPETQAILPLLDQFAQAGISLAEIMLACVEGRLAEVEPCIHWRAGACATVVMAAPGYPGPYPKGAPIDGLADAAQLEDVLVFHAGTAVQGGQVVTAGGRVLAVSGLGVDLPTALRRAYAGVSRIHFEGAHYRRDIGQLSGFSD